jgi:hypothetical protein
MLATVAVLYDAAGPITPPHYGRREEVLRKMLSVVVSAAIMVAMMAMPGVALAQGGDVCVSIKGDEKVDKGDSECFSDETSKAVATKDSTAVAADNGKANAHNDGVAVGVDHGKAHATNCAIAVAVGDGSHAQANGKGGGC